MTISITTFLTYDTQAEEAKSGRAMQAMMGMRKLDIAKLQAAFDGV
jgi:predicted 3-demethylubiquinone-9 3-methyltransferase (glyoxalase superfamily)